MYGHAPERKRLFETRHVSRKLNSVPPLRRTRFDIQEDLGLSDLAGPVEGAAVAECFVENSVLDEFGLEYGLFFESFPCLDIADVLRRYRIPVQIVNVQELASHVNCLPAKPRRLGEPFHVTHQASRANDLRNRWPENPIDHVFMAFWVEYDLTHLLLSPPAERAPHNTDQQAADDPRPEDASEFGHNGRSLSGFVATKNRVTIRETKATVAPILNAMNGRSHITDRNNVPMAAIAIRANALTIRILITARSPIRPTPRKLRRWKTAPARYRRRCQSSSCACLAAARIRPSFGGSFDYLGETIRSEEHTSEL